MTKLAFYREVLQPKCIAKKNALINLYDCERAIRSEYSYYNTVLEGLFVYNGCDFFCPPGTDYISAANALTDDKWATEQYNEFFTYDESSDCYYKDPHAISNLRDVEEQIAEYEAERDDLIKQIAQLDKEIAAAKKQFGWVDLEPQPVNETPKPKKKSKPQIMDSLFGGMEF